MIRQRRFCVPLLALVPLLAGSDCKGGGGGPQCPERTGSVRASLEGESFRLDFRDGEGFFFEDVDVVAETVREDGYWYRATVAQDTVPSVTVSIRHVLRAMGEEWACGRTLKLHVYATYADHDGEPVDVATQDVPLSFPVDCWFEASGDFADRAAAAIDWPESTVKTMTLYDAEAVGTGGSGPGGGNPDCPE